MKKIRLEDAVESLSDYARDVREEPLVVTVDGKPLAALVSVEDLDAESLSLSLNPKFLEIIERSRERLAKEGGISHAEMKRRFGSAGDESNTA